MTEEARGSRTEIEAAGGALARADNDLGEAMEVDFLEELLLDPIPHILAESKEQRAPATQDRP